MTDTTQGQQTQERQIPGEGQQQEQKGETVRETITKTIDALSKAEQRPRDPVTKKFVKREGETQEAGEAAETGAGEGERTEGDGQGEGQETRQESGEGAGEVIQEKTAPTAWSKEAKAHWENLPPEIQAAVLKRETDTRAGVEKVQKELTESKGLMEAIKPHMQSIQEAKVTPEVGIKRLLEWHDNLRRDPARQMAQLMVVFGLDPTKPLVTGGPGQQQQEQKGEVKTDGQTQPEVKLPDLPAELKPLLDHLKPILEGISKPLADQIKAVSDKIQMVEQQAVQGTQRQTQEAVDQWGEKKPYFGDVRYLMTQILVGADNTGTAGQYLDAKGRVDLDKLYDAAIYANPDIRTKVLAEQDQAKQAEAKKQLDAATKARKDQEDKARRAGVSVRGGAPGSEQGTPGQAKKKGMTVRESILAAKKEVEERGRV